LTGTRKQRQVLPYATPEAEDALMSYANSGNGSVMQDQVEEIELAPSYYEKLAFSAKYRIVHID